MMKRLMKLMVGFSLLFFIFTGEVGHAQSLEEQRETIIESLMTGITQNFTYEEVDAYLSEEEARILATGEKRPLSSYGIDGNHSTGHGIEVLEYLINYLESQTDESGYSAIYPYAVDFTELPETLRFYRYGQEAMVVETTDRQIIISENIYNSTWTQFQSVREYRGFLEDNSTQEFVVYQSDELGREVKANTRVQVQELSAHRTDYLFYFFYNKFGTLSMIKWDLEKPVGEYAEYTTRETYEELTGNTGSSASSDWSLPHDWRMLSPRRQDVPPVTWVLTSVGDGETIAIEPVFHGEGIISGYINPDYSVEVTTKNVFTDEMSAVFAATPDSSGYFTVDANATIGTPPTIKVLNESGQNVYEMELGIYQYRPTALEHESGYLTLERYFVDQGYVEGYTYPNAEVKVTHVNGYATTMENAVADSNGYFHVEGFRHQNNLTTTVITVTHPETGEEILVAPYPWTEWELENAEW